MQNNQRLIHYPGLLRLQQKEQPGLKLQCFSDSLLSDFVAQQKKKHPEWFDAELLQEQFIPSLKDVIQQSQTITKFKQHLRHYRNFVMLGLIHDEYENDTQNVMAACSALADDCINYASDWAGNLLKNTLGTPIDESGNEQKLLILAMGKLGGRELNLSSDIDLIFAYPEDGFTQHGRKQWANVEYFTKLTQLIIQLLNDVTVDGFVFRVDARLRPYGDSGAVVLSLGALEQYYLEQGRGWERFAMIKARVISGAVKDRISLEKIINPFVYRRYVDFSLLDVPRKLKRQIEAELRRRNLEDNIKLGKGGIREIEFVVQSIQLIHGGKQRSLQTNSTLKAMQEILNLSLLSVDEITTLQTGYLKLRHIEHCLQAFADKQTQLLPQDVLDRERLCYLCGDENWVDFSQSINRLRTSIHGIFKVQFRDRENVQNHENTDRLVQLMDIYLIPDQNNRNVRVINEMGYHEAEQIIDSLSQFKHRISGLMRLSGSKGRDYINELLPYLIQLCGQYENSMHTFKQMLLLIESIATRTAYLQLFKEYINTLKILSDLFSKSDWIASHTARYPLVIDDLINPSWLEMKTDPVSKEQLRRNISRIAEDDEEQILSVLREFKQSQYFQLAASFVSGYMDGQRLGLALSEVAETILLQSYKLARSKIEQRYGHLLQDDGTDVEFGIIAMGKLGSRELGFSSDLDLVFVYDSCANSTNGEKTLSTTKFFVKVAQRLIHNINSRMSNGVLYEIDTRLRPSGQSGLLVTEINAFENYQLNEAWTWEHQSLVRSRFLSHGNKLALRFQAIKSKVLSSIKNDEVLKIEIKKMRLKMKAHEKLSSNVKTRIKQQDGGIIDLEFLIQFLVLTNTYQITNLAEVSGLLEHVELLKKHHILNEDHADIIKKTYLNQVDRVNSITLHTDGSKSIGIDKDELQQNITILEYYDLYPWTEVI